jgi:hypothetical protein
LGAAAVLAVYSSWRGYDYCVRFPSTPVEDLADCTPDFQLLQKKASKKFADGVVTTFGDESATLYDQVKDDGTAPARMI